MFRASLHVGTDLNECLDYPCEDSDDAMCRHEVYIRPWFVWNIRSTENIAHQIDCSRRFFVARGCFVEGSDGRVFVADSIDYDRDALPRD